MTSSWHHQYIYDTHHRVVSNRAKFDACTYSSFRGIKTDKLTDRTAFYILDFLVFRCARFLHSWAK